MEPQRFKIALVPIGAVEANVVDDLARALAGVFLSSVSVRAMLPIPPGSYAPERDQYASPVFLMCANTARQHAGELILGVTDVDLFVPDLSFVFGQASPSERAAVISLFRLRDFQVEVFLERTIKETVHELGHVLGLSHCENPDCVMFFSNRLADTDRKSSRFCDRCAAELERR